MSGSKTERARLARVVEKAANEYYSTDVIFPKMAIKLLRRELAKRDARVRRIIEKQTRWRLERSSLTTQPDGEWINRGNVLAALRGKGTRK